MSSYFRKALPSFFMLLFGVFVFLAIPFQIKQNNETALGANLFPYLMSGSIVILSIVSIITELIKAKKFQDDLSHEGVDQGAKKKSYIRFIIVILGMLFWVLIIQVLGFVLASILMTAGLMWVLGNRNIYVLIIIPILFTIFLYFLFVVFLHVSFPGGLF